LPAAVNIVRTIPASEVLDRIDRAALFRDRWQFGRVSSRKRVELELQLLKRWLELASRSNWSAQAVWGIFPAEARDNGLVVFSSNSKAGIRLSFSLGYGQRLLKQLPGKKLAVGLQVVTLGSKAARFMASIRQQGSASERFLWHGLAAEATEAAAEWCGRKVTGKMGWDNTRRISPGYPAWPELSEQKTVFKLLGPRRIGVRLTEVFQMVPEYSTSALLLPIL
jgi:5-methyltetrahydrofolate--homocysteine methyltransferase